ncbi:ribosomal RNA-processing protein 7-domain-containing protein [Catenaria anguillulae PL171]|uniref:Ribosomal RNA-processing protein 7-domain-containing protein n=1 Tax=Catenaria anguillulae PL171 TaxID=765915 RepID=A0A1Y2H8N5_9FUNG|nr:ribosomal RNA-processing protein 7-domain-containing protein [Catenaria anguillulae PL171]
MTTHFASPTKLPNGFYALSLPATIKKPACISVSHQDTDAASSNATLPQHTLFFRPHHSRHHHPLLPPNRTLYVTNVPIGSSEQQLSSLFKTAGHVERVAFGPIDLQDPEDEGDSEASTPGASAYIVFKSPAALTRLPTTISSASWAPKHAVPLGLAASLTAFLEARSGRDALKAAAHEAIAAYDAHKAEEERRLNSHIVDEDGFVLVTRKKGATVQAVQAVAPKENVKKDFYRFQMREEKRSKLLELREKFEADKRRIDELKQARRFKPY